MEEDEDILCPTCGAYWDCDCPYVRVFTGPMNFGSNLVPNGTFADVWVGTTGPTDEPVPTPFVKTDPSAKSYARWGTHDLTDLEVQRLYREMRGELP